MIKQENLLKKIGLILEELNEQYLFMAQNPHQINQFELELIYANANFLTEHLQIIKKITNDQPLVEPSLNPSLTSENVDNELIKEEVEAEEALTVEFNFAQTHETALADELPAFEFIMDTENESDKFEFEEKQVDELFNRPFTEEEQNVLAQKRRLIEDDVFADNAEEETEELGPEPFLVYKKEEPVVIETIIEPAATSLEKQTDTSATPQVTLNDILAPKTATNSINSTTNAISDLKQGINLNDKLLFIKDLFNGFNLAYAEAIELANKLPNFEAADVFFTKNYAVKNNWTDKQQTVDKFYEILNRRFNHQG